jgi:hypothetical protein
MIFAVSKPCIVCVFVSNGAVRDLFVAAIANVGSFIQSGAAFLHKIPAGLITGRTGSTFDPADKNLFADIYFSTAKPVNAEVLGIVKGAFMIPVRGTPGLHFLRDGGWIFAQVFCNIFKSMILI